MVFPLGVLFGVLLWVFFQRNPTSERRDVGLWFDECEAGVARQFGGSWAATTSDVLCATGRRWARHYEYVQAMQFLAFSVIVPALFVVGAPWRWLGLAAAQPPRIDDDGLVQVDQSPRYVDRLVLARPHQVSNVRAIWVMSSSSR